MKPDEGGRHGVPCPSADLTQKPSWLELPEEEQVKHTYWSTTGTPLPRKARGLRQRIAAIFHRADVVGPWTVVFHSKEEAEAHASLSLNSDRGPWRWNGKPAESLSLGQAMYEARANGTLGVAVMGFSAGDWAWLKHFPAGEPLRGEE